MDIQKQIDLINSLDLGERINHLEDLFIAISKFDNSNKDNDLLGVNIIDCLNGIRSWRFIESDTDMKLLDISLVIARKLVDKKNNLIVLLEDAVYYSNYYPERFNKSKLEKEIAEITNSKV